MNYNREKTRNLRSVYARYIICTCVALSKPAKNESRESRVSPGVYMCVYNATFAKIGQLHARPIPSTRRILIRMCAYIRYTTVENFKASVYTFRVNRVDKRPVCSITHIYIYLE